MDTLGATPPVKLAAPPAPRPIGMVNWSGLWTHCKRGLIVYFHYAGITIGGPMVSGLLLLAVFSISLGESGVAVEGVPFTHYVVPGIGMLFLIYQSFQQAAFLILDDKLEGMIADTLMAPLSPLEIMLGYALQAAVTGIVTGAVLTLVMVLLTGTPFGAPWTAALYAVLGSVFFALVGTLAGLWAEKWEHYSAAETFLILPLGMLSGAFFSLASVPEETQWLLFGNPVFYIIEGFRSGFIGQSAASASVGIPLLLCLIVLLWALAWRLFAIGYKLRP